MDISDRKKLYIHIGTSKTGTTAIQKFCSSNRSALKRIGIIYPESKSLHAAHHRLWWCFNRSQASSHPGWPTDLGTPEQEWGYIIDKLSGQVNLISSEAFFQSVPKNVFKIRKFTQDFDVKIVVYWRRRDSILDSWCSQVIKSSNSTQKIPSMQLKSLPSKEKLDVWGDVFGKENVVLRPYEKVQLYNQDIVSDFFYHIFNTEIGSFERPSTIENTHLHRVALEYKRLANYFPMSGPEIQKIKIALQDVSRVFAELGRKDYSLFTPQKRLEYALESIEENKSIVWEYLNEDDELFQNPLPDPNEEWVPYSYLKKDDAILINQYLAKQYPEELAIIIRGMFWALSQNDGDIAQAACFLRPGLTVRSKEGKGQGEKIGIPISKAQSAITNKCFRKTKIVLFLKYAWEKTSCCIQQILSPVAKKDHHKHFD